MSQKEQQYNRQDLLTALEHGWKHYLPHLKELPEDEQARDAQKQGFARIQDVLVHIFSWWEASMQKTVRILGGHPVQTTDVNSFNAEVVEHYQHWTREAVEDKFVAVLASFEQFLVDLPDDALKHERIHLWLSIDAIGHYKDHSFPDESV